MYTWTVIYNRHDGQKFILLFEKEQARQALIAITKWATNLDIDFTWTDAREMVKRVKWCEAHS